jgi:copper transport protein
MLGLALAFGFLSLFTSLVRSGRQLSEARSSGSGLAILIDSGQLTRWTLRELSLLGVLGVLIRRVRGAPPGAVSTSLLVVFLFADIVLRSASSHAQGGPASLAVLSLHQAAGLAWVGGIGVLALLTGQLRERRGQALRLWRAFGPLAAGCVAVLTVTGLLLAGRQVATVDAALGTLYGGALLMKLAVVAAVMALGFRHARRLHPWLTRHPVREPKAPAARGEVVTASLGLGVLLFAMVLAVSPPARGPQFSKPLPVTTRTTYQVDDLLITVALAPNVPGHSLLLVDAVSSRRPVPGPITGVTADLGTNTGIVLRRTQGAAVGDSRWQAAVDVDVTGALPLRIVALRNHPGPAVIAGTWAVPSGLAPRAVVVSNAPLTPWTTIGAAVAALLSLAVAAALIHRRRRPATRPVRRVHPDLEVSET